MSRTQWVISDLHFHHANILTFKLKDGSPMRDFVNVDDMDWTIINNWNKVVRPQDKIYVLGDVAIKKEGVEMLIHCNGHKRLIAGNHDIFDTKFYLKYFDEVVGFRKFGGLQLTHIPIHPDSVKPNHVNVHGHLHNNLPQGAMGDRYYNVCVEMIDYTPISFEELRDRIKKLYGSNTI